MRAIAWSRQLPKDNAMPKPNRAHYHIWIRHRDGKIQYRLAWPYWSKQAGRQWAKRNRPADQIKVEACEGERCAPKLD